MYQHIGEDQTERNARSNLHKVGVFALLLLTAAVALVTVGVFGNSTLMNLSSKTSHAEADKKTTSSTFGTMVSTIFKHLNLSPPPSLLKSSKTGKVSSKIPAAPVPPPNIRSSVPIPIAPVHHAVTVFIPSPVPPTIPVKLSHKSEEEKKGLFTQFKTVHSKKYADTKEELQRYEIFKENLAKIDELNAKAVHAKYTHTSKFADLSLEEFQKRNGLRSDHARRMKDILALSDEKKSKIVFSDFENSGIPVRMKKSAKTLPSSFDWRSSGAVTPVKDQQECGGCWAFASTGDMEGTIKLKTGTLVSLSEQELISCDTAAAGCDGGMMNEAYQFVVNNGITTETQYPYTSGLTESDGVCQMPASSPYAISGWTLIKASTVEDLQAALTSEGPIAVGIYADQMQFYSSGIDVCTSSEAPNHAVLLVGYGNSNGEVYWIIKNSWGTGWGQAGYYYISTAKGACGVQTLPMKSF